MPKKLTEHTFQTYDKEHIDNMDDHIDAVDSKIDNLSTVVNNKHHLRISISAGTTDLLEPGRATFGILVFFANGTTETYNANVYLDGSRFNLEKDGVVGYQIVYMNSSYDTYPSSLLSEGIVLLCTNNNHDTSFCTIKEVDCADDFLKAGAGTSVLLLSNVSIVAVLEMYH